jgi:hypothetical protein
MRDTPEATGLYRDQWIECGPDAVRIRGYYFPWGSKVIPYPEIRGVRRLPIGALTGRGRLWGTSNPRYWASLDPRRMRKTEGLVLDVGRFVHPFITPDDAQAAEAAIWSRAGLPPEPPRSRGTLV